MIINARVFRSHYATEPTPPMAQSRHTNAPEGMNRSRKRINSHQREISNLSISHPWFQTLKTVVSHLQGSPRLVPNRGTGLTWMSTVSTLCTGCHHLGYSISLQATSAWVYPARCILTSVRLLYKQLQRSTLGTCTVPLPIKLEVGSRSIDKLLVVNVLGLYLYYNYLQ